MPGDDKKQDLDSKATQDFIGYTQNTHKEVVSCSVGVALENLNKIYPDAKVQISDDKFKAEEKTCHEQLLFACKTQEERDAVKYVIERTLDKPTHLDCVTLWRRKEKANLKDIKEISENELVSEKIVFELKRVLVLVWKAINDDSKYLHNYQGNDEERLAQAKKDNVARKEALMSTLVAMHKKRVCSHGNRNELVFVLGNTYKDIDIIQDELSTILMVLRHEIHKRFFEKYRDEKLAPDYKRKLLTTLYKWMEKGGASELLALVDDKQEIKGQLHALFINHGVNPKHIKLDETINNALASLSFSSSRKEDATLYYIHTILGFDKQALKPNQQQALKTMIKWLKEECDLTKPKDLEAITIFYYHLSVDQELKKSRQLLLMTGNMSDSIENTQKLCDDFFEKHKDNVNFQSISSVDAEKLQQVLDACSTARASNMKDQIESFFAKYYEAKKQSNTPSVNKEAARAQLKYMVMMFLSDPFKKKVALTDENVKAIFSESKDEKGGISLTPYTINRMFLHAILTPSLWSKTFSENIKRTLAFVERKFDDTYGDGLATVLIRDSYPLELLGQIKYLINKHAFEEKPSDEKSIVLPRPVGMILIPEECRTVESWQFLFHHTEIDKWEKIYFAHAVQINSILKSKSERGNFSLYNSMRIVPKAWHGQFLKTVGPDIIFREYANRRHQFEDLLADDHKLDGLILLSVEQLKQLYNGRIITAQSVIQRIKKPLNKTAKEFCEKLVTQVLDVSNDQQRADVISIMNQDKDLQLPLFKSLLANAVINNHKVAEHFKYLLSMLSSTFKDIASPGFQEGFKFWLDIMQASGNFKILDNLDFLHGVLFLDAVLLYAQQKKPNTQLINNRDEKLPTNTPADEKSCVGHLDPQDILRRVFSFISAEKLRSMITSWKEFANILQQVTHETKLIIINKLGDKHLLFTSYYYNYNSEYVYDYLFNWSLNGNDSLDILIALNECGFLEALADEKPKCTEDFILNCKIPGSEKSYKFFTSLKPKALSLFVKNTGDINAILKSMPEKHWPDFLTKLPALPWLSFSFEEIVPIVLVLCDLNHRKFFLDKLKCDARLKCDLLALGVKPQQKNANNKYIGECLDSKSGADNEHDVYAVICYRDEKDIPRLKDDCAVNDLVEQLGSQHDDKKHSVHYFQSANATKYFIENITQHPARIVKLNHPSIVNEDDLSLCLIGTINSSSIRWYYNAGLKTNESHEASEKGLIGRFREMWHVLNKLKSAEKTPITRSKIEQLKKFITVLIEKHNQYLDKIVKNEKNGLIVKNQDYLRGICNAIIAPFYHDHIKYLANEVSRAFLSEKPLHKCYINNHPIMNTYYILDNSNHFINTLSTDLFALMRRERLAVSIKEILTDYGSTSYECLKRLNAFLNEKKPENPRGYFVYTPPDIKDEMTVSDIFKKPAGTLLKSKGEEFIEKIEMQLQKFREIVKQHDAIALKYPKLSASVLDDSKADAKSAPTKFFRVGAAINSATAAADVPVRCALDSKSALDCKSAPKAKI